ncbi:MAG: hypothetical protein AMJ53_02005 [Gammaproteobacteria bacterium SG8_11]|nr:MAG: hypothetical protein AMJ53_02005 [Gammaproteobacteria bacterium SG8_11]
MTLACGITGQSFAGTFLNSCYDLPAVVPPENKPQKGLYVFIDQTMALTPLMKQAVIDLVSEWGANGERVKISRFSANISGQYSELVFDEVGNIPPTEPYLFHLRTKHKKQILACIEEKKHDFHKALVDSLTTTLKLTNDKLPKTNLIHSLADFAEQMVAVDDIEDKTVLLVTDGLENSDLFSFHKRGHVRLINPKDSLNKIRSKGLIPSWHKAKVYVMGLGYISDEKFYARPKIITPLKQFWERYFAEGNALLKSNSIGTPMLLTKSIL